MGWHQDVAGNGTCHDVSTRGSPIPLHGVGRFPGYCMGVPMAAETAPTAVACRNAASTALRPARLAGSPGACSVGTGTPSWVGEPGYRPLEISRSEANEQRRRRKTPSSRHTGRRGSAWQAGRRAAACDGFPGRRLRRPEPQRAPFPGPSHPGVQALGAPTTPRSLRDRRRRTVTGGAARGAGRLAVPANRPAI